MKYTADLRVTLVIEDGQPDDQAKRVLSREVAQFEHAIEHGRWSEKTGVEEGSTKVEVLSLRPVPRSGASPLRASWLSFLWGLITKAAAPDWNRREG